MMRTSLLVAALAAVVACSAPARPVAQEGGGRTVPLDLTTGRPVLQAQINGRGPYAMIFDTGAGTTVLLDSLEQELGLTVLGNTPIGSPLGGGEPPMGDIVSLDLVAIGGVERRGLQAVSIDDSVVPLRARGVLGPATFPDQIVEIDLSGGTMWIGSAPRRPVTHWNRIGRGDKFEATITIAGVAIPAHIDSGSPGTITLPTRFAAKLPLSAPLRESSGLRTIDATRIVSIAPLGVAADISGTPVRLDVANFADLQTAVIGSKALAGFTLVMDYANKRWALVGAAAGPIVAQPPLGDFGARIMPQADGSIEVYGLEPDSRAAASGLRIGDRILRVNDLTIGASDMTLVRQALSGPGARIAVTRGGAPLELEAK